MQHIVFGNDGVLKLKIGNKFLFPMNFLQHQHNIDDNSFLLPYFDFPVIFQENLTIGSFLKNLEPWQHFLSKLLSLNLTSFIKESKTPFLVNNQDIQFSYISLFNQIKISPQIKYSNLGDIKNIKQFIKNNQPKELDRFWNLENSYQLSGYIENQEEHYSVENIPMNKINNVPLFLTPDSMIIFDDYFYKKILGDDKELFSKDLQGLQNTQLAENFYLKYFISKPNHSLLHILKGFFLHFYKSPKDRETNLQFFHNAINSSINNTEHIPSNISSLSTTLNNELNYFNNLQEQYNLLNNNPNNNTNINIVPGIQKEQRLFNKILNNT